MENQEHLDILKQGVGEWNGWRAENSEIMPDFMLADLRDANLYGADLRDANLYGANLRAANLRGADLYGADLRLADLRDANLRGANLRAANLSAADLSGADLRAANLSGADLRDANLRDAKVSDEETADCNILYGATMPDGNRYDGRFSLEGDIAFAREEGIKTDDSSAMARWYAGDD